ncbi:MAG: hypothetical protein ABH834_01845 [Candidatus Altiarchaeota archaeon]
MSDEVESEGYLYFIDEIVNYVKTAPKGVLYFWLIMLAAFMYSISRAWNYLSIFF